MGEYEKARPKVFCTQEEKRTKNSPANAADINVLSKRYVRQNRGPLPDGLPAYGDFTNVDDYMTARIKVIRAQEAFDSLPSELRNRFANSPENLIGFLADPDNRDEAISLGLVKKPEPAPIAEPPGGDPPAPPVADPPPGDPTPPPGD